LGDLIGQGESVVGVAGVFVALVKWGWFDLNINREWQQEFKAAQKEMAHYIWCPATAQATTGSVTRAFTNIFRMDYQAFSRS
jgi:hypothetical protein